MYRKRLLVSLVVTLLVVECYGRKISENNKARNYNYVLPAGAEEIRPGINHTFVCGNKTDGFYADVDNECQIFHRCEKRARHSFICGERTLFSQILQTCVHEGNLEIPCEDSVMYYNAETKVADMTTEASSEMKIETTVSDAANMEMMMTTLEPKSLNIVPIEAEAEEVSNGVETNIVVMEALKSTDAPKIENEESTTKVAVLLRRRKTFLFKADVVPT